jgi:hypothetical protein
MAELCRRLEKRYHLQEVLNPRKFQSPRERLASRQDARKERLKANIRQALKETKNYPDFEKKMQEKGYQVLKARGIAFIDNKKVRTKGSEVGYSLQTIERMLTQRQNEMQRQTPPNREMEEGNKQKAGKLPDQHLDLTGDLAKGVGAAATLAVETTQGLADGAGKLLGELLKPIHEQGQGGGYDYEAEEERKRERERKKRRRLHL